MRLSNGLFVGAQGSRKLSCSGTRALIAVKIWMRTSASADGTDLGSLKIDPWVIGIGVGMKF